MNDSRNALKLDAPPVLRTHFGEMHVIVVNPTMGHFHQPDVMRNEHLMILPRPNRAEAEKISVAFMPSGDVLLDEIFNPRGLVLEARSGRVYGRNQVQNEEFLGTQALLREAERQSVHDYSVRGSLIMSRQMGEVNGLVNPQQRPAMHVAEWLPHCRGCTTGCTCADGPCVPSIHICQCTAWSADA